MSVLDHQGVSYHLDYLALKLYFEIESPTGSQGLNVSVGALIFVTQSIGRSCDRVQGGA